MTSTARPAVQLWHTRDAPADLVRAFARGCEEEGVSVAKVLRFGSADALARSAAEASALFIGAGIDATGGIALTEQRLGHRPPLLIVNGATVVVARRFGTAAGRLARGRPMPDVLARGDGPP